VGATYLTTLDDFAENMTFQCSINPVYAGLVDVINAWRVLNAVVLSLPMSQDDKNDALKAYTGCIAATGTDLNCYPSGLATTVCFDADGNPV